MSAIRIILLWVLVVPSILVIVIPLIDNLFNIWFLENFNTTISTLNEFIGVTWSNYILVMLWLVFFLIVYKFILRSISVFGK